MRKSLLSATAVVFTLAATSAFAAGAASGTMPMSGANSSGSPHPAATQVSAGYSGSPAGGVAVPMKINAKLHTDIARVTKIAMKGRQLTLSDGKTFRIPASWNFKPRLLGEKVKVTYHTDNGVRLANSIVRVS